MPVTQLVLNADAVTAEVGDDGATHFWRFDGEAGPVRITARSDAVTTAVALLSSDGRVLARAEDDGCPRTDSQLDDSLPADGEYRIRVRTRGTGVYRVAVRSLDRIEAAAIAEETRARVWGEADQLHILTMLVGYCFPPREQEVLTSLLVVCPRNGFTLSSCGRRVAETPDFRAIVGGSGAAPRKSNCKLVLVTHH